jgi:hypothetical protein
MWGEVEWDSFIGSSVRLTGENREVNRWSRAGHPQFAASAVISPGGDVMVGD